MKRRSWIWFLISGILALLAGVVAIAALRFFADRVDPEIPVASQMVVVANSPIAAGSIIRVDWVALTERDQIPSGAIVNPDDVIGRKALADIAPNEVIRVQDVEQQAQGPSRSDIPADKIAVALPADDILSKWGAVMPGDHVDVLFTLDVILETDMYPEEVLRVEEGEVLQRLERDQSLDHVSVLTLQNLEVLQIIEEPGVTLEEGQQAQDQAASVPQRAMVLAINPQDAVLLKYLRDTEGILDVALRSPDNGTLFNAEPVNINYLVLRYGIVLPEPLQ
ncbi:MAG: Flp pilus assembly protein CpaB [Anaerolineae bacterium]|nr:Flp pilus assembly protein CpaB [Anaerolineae bacterium]MDX9832386.1 Flp pilus assembly protein CpaB [Anaerolineae bacterium]